MTVQISPGLRLDDTNARRFATRMLEELETYDLAVDHYFGHILRTRSAGLGNPKSQQRELNRLMKAMGPTLLTAGLRHGNNKKFFMLIHRFIASATVPGDPKFLGIQYMAIHGEGRGKPYKSTVNGVLDFSMHALQRMVQRAGITCADDYQPFLRSISMPALATAMLVWRLSDKGIAVNDILWPLPVTMPNGERLLLLAMRYGNYPLLVKTVYKGEWRQQAEVLALEARLRWLTPGAPPESYDLDDLEPLLLAASKVLS